MELEQRHQRGHEVGDACSWGAEHIGVHGLVVRTLAFPLGVMGGYHKVTSGQRWNLML